MGMFLYIIISVFIYFNFFFKIQKLGIVLMENIINGKKKVKNRKFKMVMQ